MLSVTTFLPPNGVIRRFEELVDHLRNIYNGDADDLLETLKTPTLVGIEEMLHVCKQAFQFNFGTCSTEQTTNCAAQTAV